MQTEIIISNREEFKLWSQPNSARMKYILLTMFYVMILDVRKVNSSDPSPSLVFTKVGNEALNWQQYENNW